MKAITVSPNSLYEMIRYYYLDKFPEFLSYIPISHNTNIYTAIVTKYLKEQGCPVQIQFQDGDKVVKTYTIVKTHNDMLKLDAQEQEKIISFINNELTRDLKSIMDSVINMHEWLACEGYICKNVIDGKSRLHMTTKFIDKHTLVMVNY